MSTKLPLLTLLGAMSLANAASIAPTSLVVIRLGNSTRVATPAYTAGVGLPVYIDEITTAGVLVQSIPVSTTSLCTLARGLDANSWWEAEGFPTVSGNGNLVSFPCYRLAIGATLSTAQASKKTLVLLSSSGAIDTTTVTDRPYFSATGGNIGLVSVHNAVTYDGTRFYISSGIGYTCNNCWGSFLWVSRSRDMHSNSHILALNKLELRTDFCNIRTHDVHTHHSLTLLRRWHTGTPQIWRPL